MGNNFREKLQNMWAEQKFVCIGLDKGDFEFDKSIIDQTADLVCAYKLNSAFYESQGLEGRKSLEQTVKYLQNNHPEIALIYDAKRADIGNTNEGYIKDAFDNLKFDAITVHPYLGKEALQPFLERDDKGIIVLVKTSNPGSGEFQDLKVYPDEGRDGIPLYQVIAEHIKDWGANVCAVVGATYPEELKKVREIVGDMPILIPGIGAQGGDVAETVKNGLNSKKEGIIISSSRGIIYAENPREATLNLTNQIQSVLSDLSS